MPVDASIPLQVQQPQFQTPFQTYGQMASLQALNQQAQLRAQEIQKNQMSLQTQMQVATVFGDKNNLDENGLPKIDAIKQITNPTAQQNLMEYRAKILAQKAETDARNATANKETHEDQEKALTDLAEKSVSIYESAPGDESVKLNAMHDNMKKGLTLLHDSGRVLYADKLPYDVSYQQVQSGLIKAKERYEMQNKELDPTSKQIEHTVEIEARLEHMTPEQMDIRRANLEEQNLKHKNTPAVNVAQIGGRPVKVPSNYMPNEDNTAVVPIPGSPADPKAAVGNMDPTLLEGWSGLILRGVPPAQAVPRWGTKGATDREAVMNYSFRKLMNENPGMSAAEAGTRIAESEINWKFDNAAAVTGGHRAGQMAQVEGAMPGMIQLALDASKKVPRGDFVPMNKLQMMAESEFSVPELGQLKIANQGVISEYQQAITRGSAGGGNVTALKEAMDLLQASKSQDAYEANLTQVNKEIDKLVQGTAKGRELISTEGRPKSATSSTAAPKGVPDGAKLIGHSPDGKEVYELNGKRFTPDG
jgi:hypothetical protein